MYSDPDLSWSDLDLDETNTSDVEGSPMMISPWNRTCPTSYTLNSPARGPFFGTMLVGSLVRDDGHVYSLATKPGGLLYTGSDSKNIRVWKSLQDFAGFKSSSGLVKTIIIVDDKIFTGHHDGKIRVWKVSSKDPSIHRRHGSLPTLKDVIKSSLNPNNYVLEGGKRRRFIWNKHWDAVSCLSLAKEQGLLYSSSWDRTFKVWRISNSRCVESVAAHDDAVNSVAVGGGGVVFTGSADGTVKVWRREIDGEGIKHSLVKTLLKQGCAITAVVVGPTGVYCGSSDGLVRFWERLEYGGVMRGHEKAVLCLAARGRMVFSGSADKSVFVWRRECGMVHVRVAVLSGHMGPVKCLAVEKEEEEGWWRLYSGSLDNSVKVWRVGEYN